MTVIATETAHLRYNLCKDSKGQPHYQIWEKGKDDAPIALYDGAGVLHLHESFPENENNYPYINEFCYVIQDIHNMKQRGEF